MNVPSASIRGAHEPLISVIVPVRNGAETIVEQLEALAGQTMSEPWELIIVDNGSSDGTREIVTSFGARLPCLRVVEGSPTPGRAAAANLGASLARAERLAFCDADDVVGSDWVRAMSEALGEHDHVTGPIDLSRLNPPQRGTPEADLRFGPMVGPLLSFAVGCNAGYRRDVFERLGGFEERLRQGHDTDLSLRAQLAGHELWFARDAVVHRRERPTAFGVFRQNFRYGRGSARLADRFKRRGYPPRSLAAHVRACLKLVVFAPWLLSPLHRRRWAEMSGYTLGHCIPPSPASRRKLRLEP